MKLTNTLAIVGALGVFGAIFVAGCNSAEPVDTQEANTQGAPADDTSAAQGDTMNMDTPAAFKNADGELVCPVMGTVIASEDKAVGYQDHEGMRYYFCCDGCPEQFKEDPTKFTQ